MKSDKKQTLSLIGVSLLVIAGIMIYISLSQPKVYEQSEPNSQTVSVSQTGEKTTQVKTTTTTAQNKSENSEEIKYPLNINTATVDELAKVNGLGEKKASAIIEYREAKGGYKDVSEIMEIKGFGESTYQSIAPYLTV